MNIRIKVILLVAVSTCLLLLTYTIFSRTFLISGFVKVELDQAKRETDVVQQTFNSILSSMDTKAADWSSWDDSYSYVKKKNTAFEQSNLLAETAKTLNINVLAFYDIKGKAVGSVSYDYEKNDGVKTSSSISEIFTSDSTLLEFNNNSSNKGLLRLPEGLLMFTIRPVLNSKQDKPKAGYLLMGRFVDKNLVDRIASIVNQDIKLEKIESVIQKYNISTNEAVSVTEGSKELIYGFAVLRDFYNTPTAAFKVDIKRKILAIGEESLKETLTFFILTIILLGLFLINVLDRVVIKKLTDLDSQVQLLNQSEIQEISVSGNDEVARLAKSMNKMLKDLQVRNAELMSLNEIIKHQNQALVASAKMSALGEMAGGVAHEINTPLTVIKLRTEMMLEELLVFKNENTEKLTHSLGVIDKTVDRITKIIQSLRTFSRESVQQEKIECCVSAVVSDALDLCNEKFKSHGVELVTNFNTDFLFKCRPTEISQVLINILNNSYDAIESLENKKISIEINKRDARAFSISITDSGSGIPVEIQDKIMQPFFTTKEIGRGTGIGLSISKGLIESHDGSIYIDKENKNTCIVLVLPYVKEVPPGTVFERKFGT